VLPCYGNNFVQPVFCIDVKNVPEKKNKKVKKRKKNVTKIKKTFVNVE